MGDVDSEAAGLLIGDAKAPENDDGFGGNNITYFGSFCLIVNNITGPAMTAIPLVYQEAGWVSTTSMMLFIMVVSSLSATMMCRAMALIPGNDRFQGRYELISLSKFYFPKWAYILTIILFISSLQATNIAAIIESAQTMDLALIAAFDYSGGLELYPHPGWNSSSRAVVANGEIPFDGLYIISIGFVIVMVLSIPLGYFNLDDNQVVQEGAMIVMLIICCEWFVDFGLQEMVSSRVPAFGHEQKQVLGNVIFNFAYVTTIPSWVNEKQANVNINKVIWPSAILSTALFITVGWMGGVAFDMTGFNDILHVINANSKGALHIVSQVGVYLFPIVVYLSGIPVASIIIRYNLIQTGLCRKAWANFWAVIFPWLAGCIFYTGDGLVNIIVWGSLIVNGFINFVIPLLLYALSERNARAVAQSIASNVNDPEEKEMGTSTFEPLPKTWYRYVDPVKLAYFLIGITTLLLLASIGLNVGENIADAIHRSHHHKNHTLNAINVW